MSEKLVTPLKWMEYLRFGNGGLRDAVQTQPAAPPQVCSEPILTDAAPIMFRHDGRIADFRPKGILLAQELRSGPTRYSAVAAGFRTIC